jgi:hypothetical protein
MHAPQHGTLSQDEDGSWLFFPRKSTSGIILPDLSASCQSLMDTGQLFHGHTKFRNVYDARNQISLYTTVLRHVSAHGLSSLIATTSLKSHNSMNSLDKAIWDSAYDEEYDGLVSLPTWEVVSEVDFKQLSKGKRALPTMAIAIIKYDSFNKPKRAKY